MGYGVLEGEGVGVEVGSGVGLGVSVGVGVFVVVGVGDAAATVWTAAVASISSGLCPHAPIDPVIVAMITNQSFRMVLIFTPLHRIENRGGTTF